MGNGFLGTKQFYVSATIAALLIGGGAGAYFLGGVGSTLRLEHGCDAPTLAGAQREWVPVTTKDDDGTRRAESYAFDAAAFEHAALDLCVSVGDVVVEPTNGSVVELEWVVSGRSASAVEQTEVFAQVRTQGDRLLVAAWEGTIGGRSGWMGTDAASAQLTLRLPVTSTYDAKLAADVGDIHLTGLLLDSLEATADVGSIVVTQVDLRGDATARSDVGDALLSFLSVETGNVTATVDVGTAEVELPLRADVGYDAQAQTDVGELLVRIGETEANERSEDTTGGAWSARTAGLSSKPTRVVVRAIADVGDARITAS